MIQLKKLSPDQHNETIDCFINHPSIQVVPRFTYAIQCGRENTIRQMVEQGLITWCYGFEIAKTYGGRQIIDVMLTLEQCDLAIGLDYLCGIEPVPHDLLNQLLRRSMRGTEFLNQLLYHACIVGNYKMVQLLLEHGSTDLNLGFTCACIGGYLSIVTLLVTKGSHKSQ